MLNKFLRILSICLQKFIGTNMNQSELRSWENSSQEELIGIKNWINEFLCSPHPSLGREGNVCPFTREAINKNTIYFALEKSCYLNKSIEIKKISGQIKLFKTLKVNSHDEYKVIINAYPYLDKSEYIKIELIQNELKPLFVEENLMIGQFYPGCREKGLWNDNFFPLDSPISLLAIRNMAITDIAFLMSTNSFLDKYLQVFGQKGEDFLIKYMERKELHS
jgi:hypothetical protein